MSRSRPARLAVAVACIVVALASAGLTLAAPLGTAFTYQGQLRQAGVPVNGSCDFQFSLFDAVSGGTQVGVTQAASGVTLVDGRFTVQLDFGGTAFTGEARWLQIATRCPAGGGSFTALDPRQPLTPSPYALFATSATSFSGNLAGDVTGTQGATIVARLQGRNVVNTAPADGAVLRYNGGLSQWEPVVPVDVNATNYVFAFATSTQTVPAANVFQDVILDTLGPTNGWVAGGFSATLIPASAGLYLVQYEATSSFFLAGVTVSFRVTRNSTEISGSQSATGLAAGLPFHVSKSFLVQAQAGDTLRLQVASNSAGVLLAPTGDGSTPVSASVTIMRVQ